MPYIYRWRAWRRWLPMWLRRTVYARPVHMFIQRGRRGWSDEDLWGFDHYLAKVIATGFEALADRTHGWPQGDDFPEFEDFQRFLRQIAADLDAWRTDDFSVRSDTNHVEAVKALHRLAEHWGTYWD